MLIYLRLLLVLTFNGQSWFGMLAFLLQSPLFVWKLILSEVFTDEILAMRGWLMFPSRYALCGIHEETTEHLFMHCTFARSIWNWLSNITQHVFQFNMSYIWDVCNKSWSKKCKVILLSDIINTFNIIWHYRNHKKIPQ